MEHGLDSLGLKVPKQTVFSGSSDAMELENYLWPMYY